MKLIHTADLHIDSPLTTHLQGRRIRERKNELAMNFDRLIKAAVNEGADGVIIAGDLFDTDTPTRASVERVLYSVSRAKDIKFFYLFGNHEKNTMVSDGIPLPDNLFVFGEDWTYFDLGEITLAGRSTTSENMFDTLKAKKENLIVVLHGVLCDRCGEGGFIGKREAAACGARYIALGHYHSYSVERLSPFCDAVYCGVPEGRGFDETGKKGYVTIELKNNKFEHKFVEFAKRTLHILDVDVTGASKAYEVDDRIRDALYSIPQTDLVRIRLTGKRTPSLLEDTDGYHARHADGYYFFEIDDTSTLEVSKKFYQNDRSIVGEFVRHVIESRELDESDKQLVIECGLSAMGIGV